MQHPANDTFCEGKDATLNCTIYDNSTRRVADNTVWYNEDTGAAIPRSMVNNSRDGDVVTSVLTIKKVPLDINSTKYLCEPRITVTSSVAVIMVIGENSTHTHARTYAHIHTHTHPPMHAHTHIHTHPRTHTHTHMHAHKRTHTNTHTL